VSRLANPVLQALCALAQWDLEYLSALMELSHKWDQLSVLTALRAFSVHSKIKQWLRDVHQALTPLEIKDTVMNAQSIMSALTETS